MEEPTKDETREDETQDDAWHHWDTEIQTSSKREEKWREYIKKVIEQYESETDLNRTRSKFNILYSNIQVLLPAVYGRPPKPDVRRRFSDADPIAKQGAEVIERALTYTMEDGKFWDATRFAVFDGLLMGRGVPIVAYSAEIVQEVQQSAFIDPMTGMQSIQEQMVERITNQKIMYRHIQWDDFRIGPGRVWEEVMWVAFRERLTKREVREIYGSEVAAKITLSEFTDSRDKAKDDSNTYKRAEVWQIWDKETRTVKHWSPGYKAGLLAETEDPYGLKEFYPCPAPFYANLDTTSTKPLDDFRYYKDQAHTLNKLTTRVFDLIDHARVRGVYDAALKELQRLNNVEENNLIAADNAQSYYDRGGLDKAIWLYPIQPVIDAIQNLNAQKEIIKNEIYEITGISDIMRGQAMASESATAQNLKNKFGTLRLSTRQDEAQRMARDLLNLAGEIISEKFVPETLQAMSGIPITPELYDFLQSEKLRCYRIDVETDNTLASDSAMDQQAMTQLLQGITQYLTAMAPLVQSGAVPIEAAKAILMAAVRRQKMGKTVEDALDQIGVQQEMGMPAQMPMPMVTQ